MCGIVAILNVKEQTQQLRQKALRMSQKIRHRDQTGVVFIAGVQQSLPMSG